MRLVSTATEAYRRKRLAWSRPAVTRHRNMHKKAVAIWHKDELSAALAVEHDHKIWNAQPFNECWWLSYM